MARGKKEKGIEIEDFWKCYIGKRVRLLIEDTPFPRPKDGIFCGHDLTHVFLKVFNESMPKPFLKSTIRRIDVHKYGSEEFEENEPGKKD